MAHISRPEPDFVADYNENDFKGEEEKKEVPEKKKTVKFDDQNENKKEVEESKEKKEKEGPVTEQWMKNLEMLDLKSLDDLWIRDLTRRIKNS